MHHQSISCFAAAPVRAFVVRPLAWADADWALGAHLRALEHTTTFAVHAPSATRVVLELYAAAVGQVAAAEFEMARGADGVWRAMLGNAGHGTLYAFRCWGPNWPFDRAWSRHGSAAGFTADVDADGHRFNPNKVLRFDLAPVLGRTPNAFEREHWDEQKRFFSTHPLLAAIADLAEGEHVEVIAEAWDLWGYEVGNFPAGWGEWNGRYRDAVRAFLKGDGNTQSFMAMVNGDYHNFNDQGGPQRSINFVTAHDGFCLMDLVSFNAPANGQPWPFGPSDGGSTDNLSWDSGGDHALRRTRLRNFLTVLVLSRGVPMFTSGDEYGRTQNGNNNPWALDTIGMWNNWAQAVSPTPTMIPVDPLEPHAAAYYDVFGHAPGDHNPVLRFTRGLLHLRAGRRSLRQRAYGNLIVDDDDVSYLFSRPDGSPEIRDGDRAVRLHIDSSGVGDADLLVLINQTPDTRSFITIPGHRWSLLLDTAAWAEDHDNFWPTDGAAITGPYEVQPWAIAVLITDPLPAGAGRG